MRARRCFRSKARRIKDITLRDALRVPFDGSADIQARLAIFDVEFTEGEPEAYVLPLALSRAERVEGALSATPQAIIATIMPEGESGPAWTLYDAIYEPTFATALLDAVGGRRRISGRRAEVTGSPTAALRRLRGGRGAGLTPTVGRSEQSNTSVVFGDRLILKLFRRLEQGANPEIEVGEALTEARFEHTPAMGGWLALSGGREPVALAVVQQYVANEGDAWEFTLDAVSAFYDRAAATTDAPADAMADLAGSYVSFARLLGTRTAEMHRALAGRAEPAFASEPFSALYQRSVFQNLRNQASGTLALLRGRLADLPHDARPAAEQAIAASDDILSRVRELTQKRIGAVRIRTHGDYHLGQVLWTGKDVVIIDFEGEPGRPLSERRHRRSALADVAGMLRSFHYAAYGTLLNPRVGGTVRPEDVARLEPWAKAWYSTVSAAFLDAYMEGAAGAPFVPTEPQEWAALLELAMLQKVLYELAYELNNRPDWVSIPLRGLLEILDPLLTQAAVAPVTPTAPDAPPIPDA
jgi:maltose alpha-D-glucosyltransferase/alpha-amylase